MNTLTVLSWNINRFERSDSILKSFTTMERPKVIFLSEAVDRYDKVLGGQNTAAWLSRSLGWGYRVLWYPTLLKEQWHGGRGDYDLGNALLFDPRLPVRKVSGISLGNLSEYDEKVIETEPRIAIVAEIGQDDPMLLLGTHAAYSETDGRKFTPSSIRRSQFQKMADTASTYKSGLIIGDLNSPPDSTDLNTMTAAGYRNADMRTPNDPTWFPTHYVSPSAKEAALSVENESPWRLDHAFVRGLDVLDFRIMNECEGSDHAPITCTVRS